MNRCGYRESRFSPCSIDIGCCDGSEAMQQCHTPQKPSKKCSRPCSSLPGATDDGTIVIDVNAAGHGWYLDSTPRDDGEFQLLVAPSERKAIGSSPAVGHADLLTAITHEVGHILGLEHSTREVGHSVMSPTLGLGTRRVPTLRDVAILELLDGCDRRRRR